jgi:hypothetical protein
MGVDRYDVQPIRDAIERALVALDCDLPRGARVLLKPNVISQNYPAQSTTTHPAVIEALCSMLRDKRLLDKRSESHPRSGSRDTRGAVPDLRNRGGGGRYGAELASFEEDGGRLFRREDNIILGKRCSPAGLTIRTRHHVRNSRRIPSSA